MSPASPSTTPTRSFRVERLDYEGNRSALKFSGQLLFPEAAAVWADVRELLEPPNQQLDFDLGAVKTVDGGTMALLVQLQCELLSRNVKSEFVGTHEAVQDIYELYKGEGAPSLRAPPGSLGILEQVGLVTLVLIAEAKQVLTFLGQLVMSLLGVFRRPRTMQWEDVPLLCERAGADGLPIVVLINFLIGFIMAFQAAIQLKQFGANIFVADLVGLSITRELGPLMTAIIVCGRSGAAFAAQVGTMKVSEEIDALSTLGFDPMRFLVFPRVLALVLVIPFLTLIADLVGIVGGMLVGITWLDLTVVSYINQTVQAMGLWDIFSGVVKSVVFAMAISLIACQQGLATSGGAEGVGRRTTSAVVSILFSLIVIDAGFTILFFLFEM